MRNACYLYSATKYIPKTADEICFWFTVVDINSPARLRFAFPGYMATPLRAAVENDKAGIVLWLCSRGANVNQLESIWSCKPDDLLSGTCFSNICPVACYTPLHFVHSAECARILIDCGADINVQDCIGKTPLSMATLNGRYDVMEVLCSQGACVNLASNWGATPLVYAQYGRTKEERITATEILLRHGANPNLHDRNGRTPLHVVQDAECLSMLLSYGACPRMETILGKTPIIIAAENERWSLIKLLFEAEAKISLGNISRGINLFVSVSQATLTWLKNASNQVRDLKHLCRTITRKQLKMSCRNLNEGIEKLPLPVSLKLYLALYSPELMK